MTVCIAAAYQVTPDIDGIAVAYDWKLTDTRTGLTSEIGFKLAFLGKTAVALGADDIVLFQDVIGRVRAKMRKVSRQHTVSEIADLYVEAEADWRQEFLQRHVLAKFHITWDSFFEKMAKNELPQSFVDNIQAAIGSCEVPYATEAIIAGTDVIKYADVTRREANIYRITPHTKESRTRRGYAIIGEGDIVADAEFQAKIFSGTWPKQKTAFLCFVAKKRSEVIQSVGKETSVEVTNDESGEFESLSDKAEDAFEREYSNLQGALFKCEVDAYERAQKAFSTEPY